MLFSMCSTGFDFSISSSCVFALYGTIKSPYMLRNSNALSSSGSQIILLGLKMNDGDALLLYREAYIQMRLSSYFGKVALIYKTSDSGEELRLARDLRLLCKVSGLLRLSYST